MDKTVVLYRPVGAKELELIAATGYRAFPPRLPEQPFFYPVTTQEYAERIARDWNTKDEQSGYRGFVTRFAVRAEYLQGFDVRDAGGRRHQEYWIPAEQLEEFNRNIVGVIEVIAEFQ